MKVVLPVSSLKRGITEKCDAVGLNVLSLSLSFCRGLIAGGGEEEDCQEKEREEGKETYRMKIDM